MHILTAYPKRGSSHAGFAFPFILNLMLDKVGLPWTLRIWAIGSTLCAGLALLGMRPRLPVPKFTGNQRRPRFIPPQLGFLRNPIFWSVVSLHAFSDNLQDMLT